MAVAEKTVAPEPIESAADHVHRNVSSLGESATLAIHERSATLVREGRHVYRIGFGQSPFPVPERVVEALRRHAPRKEYLPVRGLEELRAAVAEHHRQLDGIDASADGVMIGPGSKELIFLLQLIFRGQVLIPSPSWVSYAPQARILGRRPVHVPTTFEDGWKVDPERLTSACAGGAGPWLLILNYPNNPVGNTYSPAELADLAEAARRHRILILADEIYGRLHFAGGHASMARFYPEGTIVSSGLSKWCGAGGWRLGTFVFPRQLAALHEVMGAVASETFTAASAPIQLAAVEAFRGGDDLDRYLAGCRRILGALGRRSAQVLRAAGVRVHEPEGGFYIFPDFSPFAERLAARGITGSPTLCERLLADTGVATLPGLPFGRPTDELTARLCYVDFDGARALEEIARVPGNGDPGNDFLERCCGDVLRAMERVVDWLG
ncbi:MAG: aminotransferase class I/II-fold pyridoxal phosphate-dependent enzyme [bacterium]|nr:aminotransferase class I/II-fold pyridoxal phosphate-dependent enzyme [bacterium]